MSTRKEELISHEMLLSILNYDEQTGVFTWRINRGHKAPKGSVAGTTNDRGYRSIFTCGYHYKEHRLAWFFIHKEWPIQIDHINRIRTDNRLSNLRNVTAKQNSLNVAMKKSNTSGYKCVVFNKQANKWQAKTKKNGRSIYLGFFDRKEDAHEAYKNYAKQNHKEFFAGEDAIRSTL